MALDVFSPAASDQNVVANAAADLPAGFSEAFDVSLRSIGEWHNSNAYAVAQKNALDAYSGDIRQKTGETLPTLGAHSEGNELNDFVSLDDFNAAQDKLKQKYPGLDYLSPLSDSDLERMTLDRMRKARSDAAAFSQRETTTGGKIGEVSGMLAGGLVDPVTIATLPLGGIGEAGIALRALEFAAIAGGSQAVTSAVNYRAHEAAVPGSSKEIPGELATATLFGAVLGAGVGGLQKLLGTGAKTLPVTVRDDLNAAASEAQLNLTNPFPTAAGEAAARDAVIDATRSAVRGEPVTAGEAFPAQHTADYALAARSQTADELAAAGERHLRPETYGEAPNVERFDRMPSEADDVASYWDKRLEAATPEERAALGATDAPEPRVSAPDLTPAQMTALEAEPKVLDASLHDLDHYVASNPDAEFTTQTRMPDGSYSFESRKLSDVLKELDGFESAAKELEACVIGLEAAQ